MRSLHNKGNEGKGGGITSYIVVTHQVCCARRTALRVCTRSSSSSLRPGGRRAERGPLPCAPAPAALDDSESRG